MARPDNDTFQYGTKPPFEDWEHDHTALVHVLWGARHQDLNLKDNADEIAEMILCSRWLAARQHLAGTSVRTKLDAVRDLHTKVDGGVFVDTCNCKGPWPCPTAELLEES